MCTQGGACIGLNVHNAQKWAKNAQNKYWCSVYAMLCKMSISCTHSCSDTTCYNMCYTSANASSLTLTSSVAPAWHAQFSEKGHVTVCLVSVHVSSIAFWVHMSHMRCSFILLYLIWHWSHFRVSLSCFLYSGSVILHVQHASIQANQKRSRRAYVCL